MRFLTIANKDTKIRLRDPKGFIMMLVMPIILTAILGSALSGLFGDSISIPETSVGIVVISGDDVTDQFIENVLQGDELKERITVSIFETETTLKKAVEEQIVDVGMILPAHFGEGLIGGKAKDVIIVSDPRKEIHSTVIESITTSFIERVTSISIASEVVAKNLLSAVPVSKQEVNIADRMQSLASELSDIASSNVDVLTTEKDGKEPISGMQYYAAAMCAMFVLFNITFGAKSIIVERKTETLARLISSPIRRSSITIGKFLGTFYFSFLQFFVFVIATHYLFKVDWGSNIVQLLVIGIAYSISVAGLSMVIAGIITEDKTADTVGGIGVQILAMLGGSMIPITAFPNSLQQIANIAPNKWALDSLLEIMNGTTWSTLILPIIILLFVGFASLFIGSLKLKAR